MAAEVASSRSKGIPSSWVCKPAKSAAPITERFTSFCLPFFLRTGFERRFVFECANSLPFLILEFSDDVIVARMPSGVL